MKKLLCFGIAICLAVCFALPASAADTIEYYQFGDVNFPLPAGWTAQDVEQLMRSGYSVVLVENETVHEMLGETPQRLDYFLYAFTGVISVEYDNGYLDLYNRSGSTIVYSAAYWVPDEMDQSVVDILNARLLNDFPAVSGPLGSKNTLIWSYIDGVKWPNTSLEDTLDGVGQAVQGVIGWVGQVVPLIKEYPGFIMMIAVPLFVGIVTWITTIYKRRRG